MSPLSTISLAELSARAALQTRVDRKYVLPLAEALVLPDRLAGQARVLEIDGERRFRYRSVYFDTPDLVSFRLTAHRRRRRFKVRTRTYLDSAQCWLEVKTSGPRKDTIKSRLPYATGDHDRIAPGRQFLDDANRGTGGLAGEPVDSCERQWPEVEGRTEIRLPVVAHDAPQSFASDLDRVQLVLRRAEQPCPRICEQARWGHLDR